jgi:peptidoglycan/LPS O-acetylase OafA/YrhL
VRAQPTEPVTETQRPVAKPAERRQARRLAWLDALRGFAALCVVFDHGSTLLLEPARDFLYHVLNLGQYGVFVFFLVSGYIIPASLERKGSVRSFWISRAFRLYPMYLVAIALSALAYYTRLGTLDGAEHHPLASVTSWALILPNLLTGTNVPNVTWTLSYEMVFYLLLAALFSWNVHRRSGTYAVGCAIAALALGGILPMAALTHWAGSAGHGQFYLSLTADALILSGIALSVTGRAGLARVGATVAALCALTLLTVNQSYPYPWSGFTILGLMFTGTLIYRAGQGQVKKVTAACVVAVVLAATVAAGLWHGYSYGGQWRAQWVSSIVLAAVTFGIGMAVRNFRIPNALAWLGLVSYSVYLLHPLIFNVYKSIPVLHQHHPISTQLWLAAVIVIVILAASAATYYGIEKPMQRLGRRVAKAFPDAPAPLASPPPASASPASPAPASSASASTPAPAAPAPSASSASAPPAPPAASPPSPLPRPAPRAACPARVPGPSFLPRRRPNSAKTFSAWYGKCPPFAGEMPPFVGLATIPS